MEKIELNLHPHEAVELHTRPCPVCGAAAGFASGDVAALPPLFDFIGRDRVNAQAQLWTRCKSCGLEFVPRAPSEKWYLDRYREAPVTDTTLDGAAANTALDLWDDLPTQNIESVIEWGSGRGAFLKRLHDRGVRTLGLEPNEKLRAVSPVETLDPERITGLPAQKFEALVLQLSAEHLYDPKAALRSSLKLLTPDAAVLIQYHDAGALPHRLLGAKSPLYDLQHLQIFRDADMARLLTEAQFEIYADHAYSNTYPLGYWARLLGREAWVPKMWAALNVGLPAGNRYVFGRRRTLKN